MLGLAAVEAVDEAVISSCEADATESFDILM